MNRAERRRQKLGKSPAVYNLTKEQLDNMVKQELDKLMEEKLKEAKEEAVNQAMILLLVLPLEVLMDHYWQKSYRQRLPKFVELVLDYYDLWQDGKLDMDELKADLWEYGGIKLMEGEREVYE